MAGNMSPALEIALQQISLNNWIEDRHTQLGGRLVCREWRTSNAFSAKITAVTLYTLADVQLAAGFFPRTPCQRLPWRSVENSRVFPNLSTLKTSASLVPELYKNVSSIALLASIDDMSIDVSIDDWEPKHVSSFQKLAAIASSLHIHWDISAKVDSFFKPTNLAALTRLTSLEICGGHVIPSLKHLTKISSLRHLQLTDLSFKDREDPTELGKCFGICAKLTQLSRLDIVWTEMEEELQSTVEEISAIIKDAAPASLRDFRMWLCTDGDPEWDSCHSFVSLDNGTLKTEQFTCSILLNGPEQYVEFDQSNESQHVYMYHGNGSYVLDVTKAAFLRSLEISVEDACESDDDNDGSNGDEDDDRDEEEEEEEDDRDPGDDDDDDDRNPGDDDDDDDRNPGDDDDIDKNSDEDSHDSGDGDNGCNDDDQDAKGNYGGNNKNADQAPMLPLCSCKQPCTRPVITCEEGVQMAATELSIDVSMASTEDLNHLLMPLPKLFPHLQQLTLTTMAGNLRFSQDLALLTSLTKLTVNVQSIDGEFAPSSRSYFPLSLRDLIVSVTVEALPLPSLSDLTNLTNLTLYKFKSYGSSVLDELYGSHVPLRHLSMNGFELQLDLPALAGAFPDLETLEMRLASSDVSPLSALLLLRTLKLELLRDFDGAVLVGFDTLTQLASLRVDATRTHLDGLDALTVLTQLRHLEYFARDCRSSSRSYSDMLKRLQESMRHTQIKLNISKA